MSGTATLLTRFEGDSDATGSEVSELLREWARLGEPSFRRAGLLRGWSSAGTVVWAAGLGWAAQRALEAQRTTQVAVAVLPSAALLVLGLVLRAVLLGAGDRAARNGAAAVRRRLRDAVLNASLPDRPQQAADLADAALAEALDGEVDRLTAWLTGYVPARRTMLWGSGLVLAAIASRSWLVALMLVAATPLLPANLKVIGLGTRAAVHAQLTAARALSAHLLDQLRGLPTLVGLGADEQAARAVEADDRELADRTGAVLRVAFLSTAWIELLVTFTMAVVATYCGLVLLDYLHLPGIPASMSLDTALFVLVLTPAYFAPVRELARGYHARAEAQAAAELLAGIIGPLLPDAHTPSAAGPVTAPALFAAGRRPPLGVELRGVTVGYPGRDRPALDDVRLTLAPGSITAVTGPSGAGKSTLLSVAAGLRLPDRGSCLHTGAGGCNPASPTATAWVGQPSHLLAGTVRDNLRLARTDATDAELVQAFADAGFTELLLDLPAGLDSATGERGHGLSSGQTQQLALVRALLRDAPLLCLDEPTAHLDPDGEERVIAAVRALARSRTVLLATHSPELLRIADRIVVLDDGRLEEDEGAGR